jgi:integrase
MATLAGTRKMLSGAGRVSRPRERHRRPTDGELVRLLAHFEARRAGSVPMADVVRFAVCTAMRLSEITSLRWDGLNEEARTVLIRDRKHPRQKKGNDQVVPLLRGPVRIAGTVVDPMDVVSAQRRRVDRDEDRVFPYEPDSVSTAFTRAVEALGIEDLHFHDLRHDGVSRLFEAGLRIEQVALVSGHRDWTMLRRYTNLRGADLHGVLEGLLGGEPGTGAKVVPLRRGTGG